MKSAYTIVLTFLVKKVVNTSHTFFQSRTQTISKRTRRQDKKDLA